MCDLIQASTSLANNNNSTNSANTLNINSNPKYNKLLADYKQIILELRAQNFDVIRFATYRTASKLRFIQKKLNLHLIDLWNVIETFRDNNLHTLDLLYELELNKLETCIQNMYSQLNKRLAYNQHINVETQTQLLLAWLLNLYDKHRLSKIKVFSIKIALTTMCAGKLVDKLKYIFNQISDQSKNSLIISKFEIYLKELLILPKSVFEEPSFGYNENISKTCFDLNSPIYLEDFLSVALSDVGPPCFIWLNIFHRFTIVQNVTHPVKCNACERTNFNGFRYKCQKCRKYQLCQDCFWRGRISHSHQLTHQMKEYTTYKSAAKQLSNSLKRSFFCKPNKQLNKQPSQMQKMPTNPQLTNHSNTLNYSNNNNVNSDYNILYRSSLKETKASTLDNSKLNAQINTNTNTNRNTLNTANTSNTNNISFSLPLNTDIYSNEMVKSSPKSKKVIQIQSNTNGITDENLFYLNDLNRIINQNSEQQTNIISPIEIGQTQTMNQFQPTSLNKQYNNNNINNNNTNNQQTYSNTLSMTRSKNNDYSNYASSNLLASFILSKNQSQTNSSSNTNLLNNDEHNLIANYCSKLADYYTKNPHLSQSPTSPTITNSIKKQIPKSSTSTKIKTNLKTTKTSILNHTNNTADFSSQSMQPISSNYRSASLSRPLWQGGQSNKKVNYLTNTLSNPINKNDSVYSAILNDSTQNTNNYATRSLSESNFKSNDIDTNELYNIDDRLLKEKQEIVAKLEKQNREIIKEIKRLKLKQLSNCSLDLIETDAINLKNTQLIQNNNYFKSKEIQAPSSVNLTRKTYSNTFVKPKSSVNTEIIAELQTLKHKKGLLENRMQMLENSRDELIGRLSQLDSLINNNNSLKQEKIQRIVSSNNLSFQSPKTSPKFNQNQKYATLNNTNIQNQQQQQQNSFVPIVSASMAMQMPLNQNQTQKISTQPNRTGIITSINPQQQQQQTQHRSWSTPSTPATYEFHPTRLTNNQQLLQQLQQQQNLINKSQMGTSFGPSTSSLLSNNSSRNYNTDHNKVLRNDLLIAADSVTNAMQNLVKELHSENESLQSNSSDEEEDHVEINSGENKNLTKLLNGSINMNHSRFVPSYSLSASTTPVTYRKNVHQNRIDLNQTGKGLYANGYLGENLEDDVDDEIDNDLLDNNGNYLYENYLIAESYIDDLNLNEDKQKHISIEDQLLNELVENSDQVAMWRKELEQILIEDPANLNNNFNNQNGINNNDQNER